ncbi:MAG: cell envelope integrity protein TolA [Treponema sp.]
MKKLLVGIVFMFYSVCASFAQNESYEQLMQKASDYEKQDKIVYALGTYYDAVIAGTTLQETRDALLKYQSISEILSNGNPGFGEYDDFTYYDGWKKTMKEYELYSAEKILPFIGVIQSVSKGPLNYENKTASYNLGYYIPENHKFFEMDNIINTGYSKVSRSDWKIKDFKLSDEEIKTFAKEYKKYWLYAEGQGSYVYVGGNAYDTIYRSGGEAHSYKVRIPGGTESYIDWISTDGNPLTFKWNNEVGDMIPINGKKVTKTRELEGEERSLTTINFNIVDDKNTVVLKSNDIIISTTDESNRRSMKGYFHPTYDDRHNLYYETRIENIPADVMSKIDSGEYKFVPGVLKIKYGYIPKISSDYREIKNLKLAEIPIEYTNNEIRTVFDKFSEEIQKEKDQILTSDDETGIKIIKLLEKIPETNVEILSVPINEEFSLWSNYKDYDYTKSRLEDYRASYRDGTDKFCAAISTKLGFNESNGFRLAFEKEIIAAKKLGIIATKEGLFLVRECYENDAQIKQQYAVKLEEERIAAEKKAEEERIAAEKKAEQDLIEKAKAEKEFERKKNNIKSRYSKKSSSEFEDYEAEILLIDCSDIVKKNATIHIVGSFGYFLDNPWAISHLENYNLTLDFSKCNIDMISQSGNAGSLSNIFSNYLSLKEKGIVRKIILPKSIENLLKKSSKHWQAVADDYKELKKIITYK